MNDIILPGYNLDKIKTIVSDMLTEATRQGASQAEIEFGFNKGFAVTARKGDVESVEYHQDKIIDITVYFGNKMGSASLSDLRPEALKSAITAACNIARYSDQDPCAGLAEKELLAFNYPELDLAFPWQITVPEAIEMAKQCEAHALAQDKRITNSEGASVYTIYAWNICGNTSGFMGMYPLTRHEISCSLIASQDDEMQRDQGYTIASDPKKLEPINTIAETAVQRTVSRLGAKRLSTRKAPVIFVAEEARGLLGHFIAAISGGNLYRKSSFLLNQIDKAIFPAHIKIDERPHLARGLGSAPFDGDSVETRSNVFIDNGILRNYALSVYSARKLGLKTTANAGGVRNLFITTGNKDLKALLKAMDTGLLVTELMGQGVNMVTGDYSRGASGFWVEKGEIQYPVEEITVAGNLREMYSQLVEVGTDVDKRGNIQTGSILIDNMVVAGD